MLTILKRSSILIIPYWTLMIIFYLLLWLGPKDNSYILILEIGGYNMLFLFSPVWIGCAIWFTGYRKEKELLKPAVIFTIIALCIEVVFLVLYISLFGFTPII